MAMVTALLVLLACAGGVWLSLHQESLINSTNQQLSLPKTAKFVPKRASLSIHLLINPNSLEEIFTTILPTKNKATMRKVAAQLRDGIFAVAGLDFNNEIATWIGSENTFTILESQTEAEKVEWLIGLSSRDKDGAKQFLQRIWQTRSLAGANIESSNHRGIDLIYTNNPNLSSDSASFATALIDDDLILIGSNKEVLKYALDISQINDQNQFNDQKLNQDIKTLNTGIALIIGSPSMLHTWLGMPLKFTQRKDLNGIVAALKPQASKLSLEGLIRFNHALNNYIEESNYATSLLDDSNTVGNDVLLLRKPSLLISEKSDDPLSQLLGPEIKKKMILLNSTPLNTIFQSSKEVLILLYEPKEWVLGTQKDQPSLSKINEVLQKDNFLITNLLIDDQNIKVWSKLIVKTIKNDHSIDNELGIILSEEANHNWWSNNLHALQDRREPNLLLESSLEINELQKQNGDLLAEIFSLGANSAQELLERWTPWRLTQTVTGGAFKQHIHALDLGIGPDEDIDHSLLRLKANLRFVD